MKRQTKYIYLLFAALLFSSAYCYGNSTTGPDANADEPYGTDVGSLYKPMEVRAFGSIRFNSRDIVTDTVFLFVNSSCVNCYGLLEDFVDNSESTSALDIYLVVIDMDATDFSTKFQEFAPYFFMLHDPAFEFGKSVGVYATPSIVVLGGDGTIKFRKIGYENENIMELIEEIFN